MREPVFPYDGQVRELVNVGTPFDDALYLTIQNMVDDYAEKYTCLRIIASISQAFLGHDGVQFRNFYRAQARLRDAAGGSPATDNDDPIYDVKGLHNYTGWTVNWIHKHSYLLTHIQYGKRGKLRFRKSDIDKYLKTQSTPGIGG